MTENRTSVVHEIEPGDGLTVAADQSLSSSRVDPSRLPVGGDLSRAVVELPDDVWRARSAYLAAAAHGSDMATRQAWGALYSLIAARVRAEASGTVAAMCHWVQDVGGVRARESHEAFHFGYSCPYEAVAAVLRGEPDPRRDAVSDSDFLALVRAEAVADCECDDLMAEVTAAARRIRDLEAQLAEAVAAERQRVAEEIATALDAEARHHDEAQKLFSAAGHAYACAAIIARAAGSVPVATPPATCASWVSSNHDDEDVSRCGGQSVGEWLSTSGQWQPVCARHSEGVPSDRLRAMQAGPVATEPALTERPPWPYLEDRRSGAVDVCPLPRSHRR
jgi:hypothetical protein